MSQLTSPQIALLEDAHHISRQFLAVIVPDDVITAQVDGNQARGETVIPYKTVSGTEADVLADMTVWFGTGAGERSIGTARVKSIDAVGNELTIEENDLDLSDNEYITVKRVWEPRSKLQAIDTSGSAVVYTKDGESWTDQTVDIPPIVNMGPPGCYFIDAVLGYATVYFVDEYSSSLVGAALSVVTWDYDGGALQGGAGTAASPYEVRYSSNGLYWVSLTITDANGKVSVGYRPIVIYEWGVSEPYYDYSTSGRSLSVDGADQSFTVFGTADQTEFPDGAMVIRFNHDYYDGVLATVQCRYPKRGDVKYVGYLRAETIETNTNLRNVSFDTVGIGRIADELPGFGDRLTDAAVPTSWVEMHELDIVKAVHHCLLTQSTLLTITDFRWDLPYTQSQMRAWRQRWGKASVMQLAQLPLESIFSHLAATSQGLLEVRMTPHLMNPSDRAANITTVVDLDKTHFSRVSFSREPFHKAETVRATGIGWDGVTESPFGSRAPDVPDVVARPNNEDIGGLVVIDQARTNQLAGDYLAMANNPYPEATVDLPGNWDVFEPALKERVTLTLAADDNRGLVFDTDDDWVVESVMVAENPAGGFVGPVTLTLSGETTGTPGVAIVIGGQPTWPVPDPPEDEGGESDRYVGTIMGTNPEGAFYSPDNEFTALPTWYGLQNDELTASGSKNMSDLTLVQDGSGAEALYAMTYCGFYKLSMPPGSGSWEARIRNYEIAALAGVSAVGGYAMMDAAYSIINEGHAWAVLRTQAGTHPLSLGYNLVVCHTHDGWQTLEWAQSLIYNNSWHAQMGRAQLAIAQDGTDNVIYLAWQSGHYTAGNWGVKKSIDGGATWPNSYTDTVPAYEQPRLCLHCPYSNPNYVYAAAGTGKQQFAYSVNGGGAWSTYNLPNSNASWLTGPLTDETVVTLMDCKEGLSQWNGSAFIAWGESYDWWQAADPDAWGGWAYALRILERDASGGLVKAVLAGEDRASLGKVLLMEAGGRTVITENWNTIANDDWPNAMALPELGESS